MNYVNEQTPFTKALLTGVFVGITSSVVCLVFNGIYRDQTGLAPSDIINVGSIIFGVNIAFLVIGLLYYVFTQIKKGEFLFITLFLILTVFLALKAEGVTRSADPLVTLQFRRLLLGIIIIAGFGASVALPLLAHNKKFSKNIL